MTNNLTRNTLVVFSVVFFVMFNTAPPGTCRRSGEVTIPKLIIWYKVVKR